MTIDPRHALIVSVGAPGAAGIVTGSAIIAPCNGNRELIPDENGRITVWYEGNTNGAVNLHGFIERVRCASGRMSEKYPTSAIRTVSANDLTVLAEFDQERGIIVKIREPAALDLQAGEDAGKLFARQNTSITISDKTVIMASANAKGGRLISQTPFAFQCADGHVVVRRGDKNLMLHPASQDLDNDISDLSDKARFRILGSDHAAAMLENTLHSFSNGPVLQVASGAWYEIENIEQAASATLLTETAIAHFWNSSRQHEDGDLPHRWFVLVGPQSGKTVGCVAMAAMRSDDESDPTTLSGPVRVDCHVTGYNNTNVYMKHEADILALAAATGIKIRPNWMGQPLPDQSRGKDTGYDVGFDDDMLSGPKPDGY